MGASYSTLEEANAACDVLRDFGIVGHVERERPDAEGIEWCEVTIVELPAKLMDTARVVATPPRRTTHPDTTELDEHDYGASTMWDREWERGYGE